MGTGYSNEETCNEETSSEESSNEESSNEETEQSKQLREKEWERWKSEDKPRLEEELDRFKRKFEKTEALEVTRKRIAELKFGDSDLTSDITYPQVLNIGLFGIPGVGKSSFLNSLKFAVKGELREIDREQAAPQNFKGGHSTRRLKVGITPHITVIDNRGVSPEDLLSEGCEDELINQIEGKGSYTQVVNWRESHPSQQQEKERIYCTVFVLDARSPETIFNVIKKFVEKVFQWQGLYPLAIVTHVDKAKEDELESIRLVLRSVGIEDFYEIANITKTNKALEEEHQALLLEFLERCIKSADRIFQLRQSIECGDRK